MTKIIPNANCLSGEHVFIPCKTITNMRESIVDEFVCQHCLLKVNRRQWEIHQQELARYGEPEVRDVPFPSMGDEVYQLSNDAPFPDNVIGQQLVAPKPKVAPAKKTQPKKPAPKSTSLA